MRRQPKYKVAGSRVSIRQGGRWVSSTEATQAYHTAQDRHWGATPAQYMEIPARWGLPPFCSRMGALVALEVSTTEGPLEIGPAARAAQEGGVAAGGADLLFSPVRPNPMFIVSSRAFARDCMKTLWVRGEPTYTILAAERELPGRQTRVQGRWKARRVQLLGELAHVYYYTYKSEPDDPAMDTPATYKHPMGEANGVKPLLGVSREGWLWFVGGDYTVPRAGITN